MEKKKILIVFGTRPEAIKMAPVIKEFQKYPDQFETKVCVTAQHREMLDQVLDFFEIKPDYDLNLMQQNQTLSYLTVSIIESFAKVLEKFKADFGYVHGDTTTTFATSLCAFYSNAKVCHVEAGLRTFNKNAPFPEEINRQLTGRLADYHFAPTTGAKLNLLKEGVSEDAIIVTGNTVIDSLLFTIEKTKSSKDPEIERLKQLVDKNKKLILVTGHRRENFGEGFQNICNGLKDIAKQPDVKIIYPVHLNPKVRDSVFNSIENEENIHLINPLSYEAFIWLMNESYLIITESGGIQEEAPSLGKPVLLMRETTERPEAIETGAVILVGTKREKIVNECLFLLENERHYNKISLVKNPFGMGDAASKIIGFQKGLREL